MAQTVNFQITGEQKLHCAGCEQRLGTALRHIPGIDGVQASAKTQQVAVSFDPAKVAPEQVSAFRLMEPSLRVLQPSIRAW